jgi:alkanesulfonate monooxygenase
MTSQLPLHIFSVSPRSTDPQHYWTGVTRIIELSERYGLSGVLIFTGNDTFVEPWVTAQHLVATTRHLIPLVAVNPVYMHPFTVAKLVSSLAYVFARPTWLNMVTGAALSYLRSVGDAASHDTRYQRLSEYLTAVAGLLTQPRLSLDGQFYQLDKVQLLPRPPRELAPRFLLSGQSPEAHEVARRHGAVTMQMLPPGLLDELAAGVTGIHFGIITRRREADAWAAARRRFPEQPEARAMLQLSLANTDSHWKQRMVAAAAQRERAAPGFWLEPFCDLHADCPYFVGSHDQVAALLRGLAERGVTAIILDLPADDEELAETAAAIALAGVAVQRAGDVAPGATVGAEAGAIGAAAQGGAA